MIYATFSLALPALRTYLVSSLVLWLSAVVKCCFSLEPGAQYTTSSKLLAEEVSGFSAQHHQSLASLVRRVLVLAFLAIVDRTTSAVSQRFIVLRINN